MPIRDRSNRNALTAVTFVEIVDTLVDDFDVIDVLTVLTSRSVELLEAAAAGILLADTAGHLRVMAASTEQIELLELFQIQNDEGPCLDCFHTGAVVVHANLEDAFAVAAVRGRERPRRVPVGVRRPAAAQGRDPRLSEPVHVGARLAVGGRRRTRAGTCRCRQHRHRPGSGHTRSRDPRGPVAARAEQPHRDRTGQGHDRRTRPRRHGRRVLDPARGSPGTTTAASPRSREHSSRGTLKHRHVDPRSAPSTATTAGDQPARLTPTRRRSSIGPSHDRLLWNR